MNNVRFYKNLYPNLLDKIVHINEQSRLNLKFLEDKKYQKLNLDDQVLRSYCRYTFGESYGKRCNGENPCQDQVKQLLETGLLKLHNLKDNKFILDSRRIIEKSIREQSLDQSCERKPRFYLSKDKTLDEMITASLIDNELLKTIKSYLGTNTPYIHSPDYLFTPKMSNEDMSIKDKNEHAFLFHRDMPGSISLKIYIQLSASPKDGHHFYVENSHIWSKVYDNKDITFRSNKFKPFSQCFDAKTITDTFYHDGRFSDNSIKKIFGEKRLARLGNNFGDVWIEDNYGLHKGSTPKTDSRLLATILITKYPTRKL